MHRASQRSRTRPTSPRCSAPPAAVHVADAIADYAVRLARATREPSVGGAMPHGRWRSARRRAPRCFLVRASRARALLDGRTFATPYDVKRVAPDVLRHRIVLTYEAEADGVRPDSVVDALLRRPSAP